VNFPSDSLAAALGDRYRVERELGAGGMATVYLAHDLRHDRKVAVKVLKPELAAVIGAERFLSEIRTTANLQHPHILPLHDSGAAGTSLFYVMPFVEGESLRDRLNREKQLPVEDALRITAEVASALDYAHRRGVIHRDIKPENILLHDGSALVADFGIALAASHAGGSRLTETGMSIGTPNYMSPEQAIGERELTGRSDVFSLACVTYEMLTGDPPFSGSTAQAVVARVMTEDPRPITLQRRSVPAAVEAAVLTALEKLPADRFATAAQFAAAIAARPTSGPGPAATMPMAARASALPRWVTGAAVGVAVLSLAFAVWAWRRGAGTTAPVTRNIILLGDSTAPFTAAPSLALSPDGTTLVYRNGAPGQGLWVKRRDLLQPVSLPGTDRATNPAFSPDGKWIAFVADGKLRKVGIAGGPVSIIADSAAAGYGGPAWLEDGTIIFVPPRIDGFRRVSAGGGPVTVALNDTAFNGHGVGMPIALPGSRGVLFQACTSGCATMGIRVLDLRSGTQKLILPDAAHAVYLGNRRLLYVRRDGTAVVTGFDLDRLEVAGQGTPVFDGVQLGLGFAHLAGSSSGTLVYIRGSSSAENVMVRVGNDGRAEPFDPDWYGAINSFALSPDGRHLSVGTGAADGDLNVWIKRLDRGPVTRLSFGGRDRRPAWSPDGKTVAFIRDTGATSMVMARAADGSSTRDRLLARIDHLPQEIEWSSDGQWLVLRTDTGAPGAGDLIGIRLTGDTTPVKLVATTFTELTPAVSPDTRWLAYTSNESGAPEVYVRPFPNTDGGHWQVSVNGGSEPRWSHDGRTLFFLDASKVMTAAHLSVASGFEVLSVEPPFDATGFRLDGYHQSFEVAADGKFVFRSPRREPGAAVSARVVWMEN
jgi:eukaryotic-like serine/threonine-protein kinase